MTNPTALPLTRRHLLQGLALGSLASLASASFAAGANPAELAFGQSYAPFDGPLAAAPGAGFAGTLETADIPLRGRLPEGLRGTLYRNGPARFKLGTTRYQHWFDGDGMVQAFRIGSGKASHRGVLLRTPKLLQEEAAGRFLYPAFGTPLAGGLPVRDADAVNVANINLLPMADGRELYALWEGGSALQLDPHTLAAQGFKAWSPETRGASFSAHPRVAPDGTVWNFGYAGHSGKLILYEIDRAGRLKRQALIDAPQADMVHDFAITERHLVFLLMPLHLKPDAPQVGSLDRFDWQAQAPLIALVVSRADLSVQRFELPNGGVFHLGNAWEEQGVIRLGYARYTDFLGHLQGLTLPAPRATLAQTARWTQVELNLAQGTARQTDVGLQGVEFPSFDRRFTGERTALTVLMQTSPASLGQRYGADRVLAVTGEQVQAYSYGPDWIAEEHLYVPRPNSGQAQPGWVLGTALHRASGRTTLWVFEAAALADGPVAQLALPYGLPLGLHGQFVAA
jgi:all-trans-8'-apo-beta-carotenal 15,15'-oxygenase